MTLLVGPPLTPQAALRELARLRRELDPLLLTRRQRLDAEAALSVAEEELGRPAPDVRRVAGQLARFRAILRGAGALEDASDGLTRSLGRLRAWLGPLPI